MLSNNFAKNKIAIIGGGFGGIEVFKKLQKNLPAQTSVTLFNTRTDFIFTPLLHEAATGGVSLSNIAAPIRSFVKSKNAEFVQAQVTEINPFDKVIKTATCSFNYDYLVVATGSISDTRDVKGADENCHFLKTVEDSVKLRKSILETLEKYSIDRSEDLLKVTIIGGGSTGVELALEIDEYIRNTLSKYYKCEKLLQDFEVFLVCPSEKVLSYLPDSIRNEAMHRLNQSHIRLKMSTYVTEVGENYIITDTHGKLPSSIIVWCGGVSTVLPNFVGNLKLEATKNLNLADHKEIFVLGDCINYGTNVPMDAQSAVKQADVVSSNILNLINNKPLIEFKYKKSGTLVSLGRWNAVGLMGPIFIKGPLAWWIWRTIYLFKFPLASKRIKIAIDWTVAIFSGRDISNV
jgi:NADH dehydrogenase